MAPTPQRWATSLLHRLGIQPTAANTRALVGWAKAEGGHWNNQARFNPLNTTQPMPGAGNTGSQGNIKQYTNWQQGLDATVRTLRNGRYQGILDALKSNNESAVVNAVGNSPWGTNSRLLAQVLGSTAARASTAPRTSSTPAPSPQPAATPDTRQARAALVTQFLANKHASPVDLALGIRQLDASATSPTAAPAGDTGGGGGYASRAGALDAQRLPYQWGGGHGGRVDPHKAQPLDCSGAVSAVLGIDPRVSGDFANWGNPGEGGSVTVYSNPKHVLMSIRGNDGQMHFFGTSASNPGGGAGWIPRSQVSPQYLHGFTARHI